MPGKATEPKQWAIWTTDGQSEIHTGMSLARIARQIEGTGLGILAAVEVNVLVRPDGSGAPIRAMIAANRGSS